MKLGPRAFSFFFAGFLSASCFSPVWAEVWDARLTEFSGPVYVRAGGTEDWRPAIADAPLEAGDEIEVGAEGSAEIGLDGENVIDLGAGSGLSLEALEKEESTLALSRGSLLAKLGSSFRERKFRVKTPVAVAAVRGTEFAVEVQEEGTDVAVFDEGNVSVQSLESGEEAVLDPNREVAVRPRRPLEVRRLERLLARRAQMERLRGRLPALREEWKLKRRMLREEFLKRRVIRREKFERMRQEWRKKGPVPRPRPERRLRRTRSLGKDR